MLKCIFFWVLIGSVISLVGCGKFMSKKLNQDSIITATTNTSDSLNAVSRLPVDPNRDLTGFPNRKKKIYLVASIKKTLCLGGCPIYEAKLYSNGKTTFYGRKNVDMKGRHEGQITEQLMKELIAKVEAVDFFNFESSYPTKLQRGVSEFSTTILTSQIGNRFKKVKINSDAPDVLVDYEQFLDALFQGVDWDEK